MSNPKLLISFSPSSGDIYLSLGISVPCLIVIVSELFCWDFFQALVILITNQIISCF